MKITLKIFPFIGTDLNKQESFCRTWDTEEIADGLCPFYLRHWMHDGYHYLPNIPESNSDFGKFPVPKDDKLTLTLHVLKVYRAVDSINVTVQGFDVYEDDTRTLRDTKDIIKKFRRDPLWKYQSSNVLGVPIKLPVEVAVSNRRFPSGMPIDMRDF